MAEKGKILEVLGGNKADLLLMEKVRRALQANERVKYLLSLLQLSVTQAHSQASDPDDLSVERRRAGIEDAELDRVISGAALSTGGAVEIPVSGRIIAMALDETDRMCAPLRIARPAEAQELSRRLEAAALSCSPYTAAAPAAEAGMPPPGEPGRGAPEHVLPAGFVPRLTSADRRGPDSLHLVVMDVHKALNGLIAELGGRRDRIGAAETLGLVPEDRRLVEAFMAGLESTSHLKGSHPGLGTTAMRVGAKLLIQNDIGETDAHMVLVEIEDGRIEITYTDVHDKRVEFFTELLGDLSVKWKKTESRTSKALSESAFFLLRGILQVNDPERMAASLKMIGASLVFLIDWNKARKRLRTFLRGADVLEVLKWSSRERFGHMAFITYGDEELIYEALEALPRGTVRLGEPLSEILGRKSSVEFMKEVLRLCRECLDRKEPRILLVDRLRCLLLARAQRRGGSADEMLLELGSLGVEASITFRDAIRAVTRPVAGLVTRAHARICAWEERADDRLNRMRKLHLKEPQPLLPVAEKLDDALDSLEDAGDLAQVLSERLKGEMLPEEMVRLVEEQSELALESAQLFLRSLYRYRELLRGGLGEPLFASINELKQAEQRADTVKRSFRWKFLEAPGDAKAHMALRELHERIEEAINSLCRGGFLIHDLAYAAMEQRHG